VGRYWLGHSFSEVFGATIAHTEVVVVLDRDVSYVEFTPVLKSTLVNVPQDTWERVRRYITAKTSP